MRLPNFTAEASLGETKKQYTLCSRIEAEAGKVVPQGYILSPNGDLWYCYDEGGFSGCFQIGSGRRTRF